MGKKTKKASAKKMFITKKVNKTQAKVKNIKSGKIKAKSPTKSKKS